MQPVFYPSGTFGALIPAQTAPTIGDRLTDAGVDWAWYAGGWSNADGDVGAPGWTNGSSASATATGCSDPFVDPNSRAGVPAAHWPRCPDNLFQYHHQPFNYFAAFSTATPEGMANRAAHLKDEVEFMQLADSSIKKDCELKPVSFVKPFGTENEHPGYASEPNGSDHLVDLLQRIQNSKCAKDTMVIVTYDEFGGQWDHVPPPGQGNANGPHDIWGPGTRVPALVIAPHLKGDFVVDSTQHDTTSILSTIEHRYGLAPLGTRDAAVADLSTAFDAKKPPKEPASLAWSPSTSGAFDYGEVAAPHTVSQQFTLSVSKGKVKDVAVSLSGSAAFSITADECTGTKKPLEAKKDETCTVTVQYAPASASDTATLTADADKPDATTSITLTGSGALTFTASGPAVAGLSPLNEPSNPTSAGTGTAVVTWDTTTSMMTVNVIFGGLTTGTTASHIHCCVAAPGTAGVATTTPTFTGFPLGVTSGNYSHTFDMLDVSSYNPSFVTANGGTAASAEAVLFAGLQAGQAYLNVHTSANPGGEIRGFLHH